jgi:hypothetical protein
MTGIIKILVRSLAVGALLALILASVVTASHRRPGAANPLRVPLVPTQKECVSSDTTHNQPLPYPACSTYRIESEILTMSPRGAGGGFVKLSQFCTDAIALPCDPANGTDTLNVKFDAFQSDVLCAVGGISGCSAPGADYTGQMIFQVPMRITDHANAGLACPYPNDGDPPCVTGTVKDSTFSVVVNCAATPASINGATCQTSTSMDALAPGTVKEFQRAVISVTGARALDTGPDTSAGANCPLSCGTGDETLYAGEGIFIP